jgi:pimeloyl-ACP methyl ester carboxylesterase
VTATVVLVHGAWHGAWCFDRVVARLVDAGVATVAVDLPGHGDDPGPLTDLHGDATRVREVLDRVDGPAVLLGHSYGGAVVTEAGSHPAVERLVYLCALVLDGHETCQSAAAVEAAAVGLSHEGRPDLGGALVPTTEGATVVPREAAAACFYNDCDATTVDWAVGRLSPQSMAALSQSPNRVAWRDRPSTYVVCENDMGLHPGLQQLLRRRCTDSVVWPTGHSPFLSRPELVTELLVRLSSG